MLEIADGMVTFTPDSPSAAPGWSVPARQLTLGRAGVRFPGSFVVRGAEAEDIMLEVSTSEGARWREAGDARDLPDRSTHREVQQILVGWGARSVRPRPA
ncbi:hypothetical protein KW076_06110 [Micrococcus porci]|uniref:hypothetical protein n=1 Tax=Micrococcus TaxID=1269 RepID=UPI001CCC996D|nr:MULTISPECIES: hypothetical protein [Micrococcus]MCG7421852.1 hypothetical protein [Micrococcus sp. ACRRV]UBH25741.1 hypothetical protein KW076_06110 [Micrococcus porci]